MQVKTPQIGVKMLHKPQKGYRQIFMVLQFGLMAAIYVNHPLLIKFTFPLVVGVSGNYKSFPP